MREGSSCGAHLSARDFMRGALREGSFTAEPFFFFFFFLEPEYIKRVSLGVLWTRAPFT
jgi:hypothetical protein